MNVLLNAREASEGEPARCYRAGSPLLIDAE